MMSEQHLYVFAKPPVAGKVKGRLGLPPADAAALAAANLRDVLARHAQPGRRRVVWRSGALDHPFWSTLGVDLAAQPEGEIGARVMAALKAGLAAGARVVIIGAGCPTLPPGYVDEAFRRLETRDVVLGPTERGGIYLIGASAALPEGLLEGIEWGSGEAWERLWCRVAALGLSAHRLRPWYHLERAEDLRHLKADPGDPLASESLRSLAGADPAYCEALDGLFARHRFGEKLDLSTPSALNEALGRPLDAYRSVLIAGTNGKGSASAFLEALLRGQGLRTGLFSSPHLNSFTERIRIDGAPIAPQRIPGLIDAVVGAAEAADLRPSFFETTWGMAARAFAEAGVDVVIWEVGLGGRLDATNVCDPVASGITSVGLDHTHILGDTIEAVAREKAGVLREGRPALTSAIEPALSALRAAWPSIEAVEPAPEGNRLPLPGAHQRRNAGLALALARALGVTPRVEDLEAARWPGRMERVGDLLLDCAHNPHAAEALAAALDAQGLEGLHLVYGAMQGKDVAGMAGPLMSRARSVALVTPDYPRRQTAEEIAPHFAAHPDVRLYDEVAAALQDRPRDRLTLVVGSCFLVAEARAWAYALPYPECGLSTKAR